MRFRKPFFRSNRRLWYVQLDGKQINLGPERAEAFKRYHALMAEYGARRTTLRTEAPLVVSILDLFLDWCKRHKAARTYEFYLAYLQSFAESIPPGLIAADLRPFHLQQWIDAHPGWKTGKRGAIISVQRAFNWAVKFGHILQSPVAKIEKPPVGRRHLVLDSVEFGCIFTASVAESFRDLLTAVWETGCRPHEAFRVEARHFNETSRCWIFPPEEAKGGKTHRVIYLPDNTLEITKRLVRQNPTGPLFRNTEGLPWTATAVKCRFQRIQKKLGLRCNLYALRHSFCTRALTNGVDAITTARLMGHASLAMINKVYAHVEKDVVHMTEAAKRAAGGYA